MTPRQAFGVVVRTIGFIAVLDGIYPLLNLLVLRNGYLVTLIISAIYIAAGLALMSNGEFVVRFAYRHRRDE